jgi:hypothetical protein
VPRRLDDRLEAGPGDFESEPPVAELAHVRLDAFGAGRGRGEENHSRPAPLQPGTTAECQEASRELDHMERPTSALHLTRVTLTV